MSESCNKDLYFLEKIRSEGYIFSEKVTKFFDAKIEKMRKMAKNGLRLQNFCNFLQFCNHFVTAGSLDL